MNSRFVFWALALILSLVEIGLCIRLLALRGAPLSDSLALRGASCLLLVILLARRKGLSLRPKKLPTQFVRAVLAGLALTFLSLSYNWLTASTVSVLSNIDVPLLVAMGPLAGVPASKTARSLSLVSILFLVWSVSGLEPQTNLIYGLGTLLVGTLLLCLGYLYIKKSMTEENEAVAILTPSLALIAYGLLGRLGDAGTASAWTPESFFFGALSGAGMFVAYVSTMKLYELTDIASAEFPTLLSSLAIQPAEAILLHEHLNVVVLASSIGFVMMTYLIMNMQSTSTERSNVVNEPTPLDLPRVAQTLDYTCGAACFESMFRYFKSTSPGEMHFAKELGALTLGYTPPKNVLRLARDHGFKCEMIEGADIADLRAPLSDGHVIFVTWWDEDAGHYSLVKALDRGSVTLMDPWAAREGVDNRLALADFIPHWKARGGLAIIVSGPC